MQDLDEATRTELRALGRRRRFRTGKPLFIEGDRNGSLFLIESGWLKVFAVTDEGREVILAIRGPGDVLGELSALDTGPRSASAIALEAVDATVIPPNVYLGWLASRPDVLMAQLVNVIARLRESDIKRVELSSYDIDRRVALRLHELATSHGEPVPDGTIRITVPISQEELGGYIGASREAVAQSLRRLRDAKIIETSRRGYLVLKPDELAALAAPL